MENTINNVSFKANIKTLTKIKNKSAYSEAKKLFEKSTKNDSKDVLYISDGIFGESRLELDDTLNPVFTHAINQQLQTLGTEKFAEKLVKIYEALKLHSKANKKNNQLKAELDRANALLNLNLNIANAWASEGKNNIANKYNVLATRNRAKIDALTKEKTNRLENFNKKIDELSKEYEELNDLKINVQ